jgi:hypothetical protein
MRAAAKQVTEPRLHVARTQSTDGELAPGVYASVDAERAVLCALLTNEPREKEEAAEREGAILKAIELLDESMFYREENRRVFRAMVTLRARAEPIDPITLTEQLGRAGDLETSGGREYVTYLTDAVPGWASVEHHAKIVREKWERRQLRDRGEQLVRESGGAISPSDVLSAHREVLASLNFGTSTPRIELLNIRALDKLPVQGWLIAEKLPANALAAVIGAKSQLKTFVALDIALHKALGLDWQGSATPQGAVVYLYTEGPFGARSRVNAWCKYQEHLTGMTIDRDTLPIWFIPVRVPMNDPGAVDEMLTAIKRLPAKPVLIVIDTLNRNIEGDEDGRGMTGFVAGCSRVQAALGCTVMPVHHTPYSTDERGRGHGSLDGALDTRLNVSRDADRVVVECTHQRNGPDGWQVAFEAIPIAGSLVLKSGALDGGALKGQRLSSLEVLHQQGTAKHSTWLKATELNPSSFRKARKWLLANSYVQLDKATYSLTDAGKLALSALGSPEVHRD